MTARDETISPDSGDRADDWEIVRLCASDKERHFSILVKRHYALVANLCLRFLLNHDSAKDATQEIFMRVYQTIDAIRDKGIPFTHWLCKVASNHCRNVYKKQKKERENLEAGMKDLWYETSVFIAPDTDLEKQQDIERVNRALAGLDLKDRIPLVLAEMTEMKTKEISRILHLPQYAVRRRLNRAKAEMKRFIVQEQLSEETNGNKNI